MRASLYPCFLLLLGIVSLSACKDSGVSGSSVKITPPDSRVAFDRGKENLRAGKAAKAGSKEQKGGAADLSTMSNAQLAEEMKSLNFRIGRAIENMAASNPEMGKLLSDQKRLMAERREMADGVLAKQPEGVELLRRISIAQEELKRVNREIMALQPNLRKAHLPKREAAADTLRALQQQRSALVQKLMAEDESLKAALTAKGKQIFALTQELEKQLRESDNPEKKLLWRRWQARKLLKERGALQP